MVQDSWDLYIKIQLPAMDANNQWNEPSEVFANSSELKSVKYSYLAGREWSYVCKSFLYMPI